MNFAELVPDPGDPVQGFDEAADFHVIDLGVDAVDHADAEADTDLAIYENDLEATHDGQNWIEALVESTIEAADPQIEIGQLDADADEPVDLPVADRGSGGPAGV